MSKARAIELATGVGLVLAYILLKALAKSLEVDLGVLQPVLEMLTAGGAGAVLFKRPSDSASEE